MQKDVIKGQVISGEVGKICVRQKSDQEIEIGELLIAQEPASAFDKKILLQVYDLGYGSQISQQNLELIAGLQLEEGKEQASEMSIIDEELKHYKLAFLKTVVTIKNNKPSLTKTLPRVFTSVSEVQETDLQFITKPKNPLFLGNLRSGSKELAVPIFLDGQKVLSHHVLIPATTGRGKSNLTSCLLWNSLDAPFCGFFVLDPHDEYYGRHGIGLKDHPINQEKKRVFYYTAFDFPANASSLKINLELIKPHHFNGAVDWSDPQKEALYAYYKKYGKSWIEAIILEKPLESEGSSHGSFHEGTLGVVRRRMLQLLDLEFREFQLFEKGIFSLHAGTTTIADMVNQLEQGNTVIVDTSSFSGAAEILVGSILSTEIFNRYRSYKAQGKLHNKPVIGIILEEAPRVLGKEVLERGSNIFSTIAREGRKFQIGLVAITQLPSLIPREILANMNTKIILGIEMAPERQAVIDSSAQDLSNDHRAIASLDKGEAIITSNFSSFAIPVKIPLFQELVKKTQQEKIQQENRYGIKNEIKKIQTAFPGIGD